MLDNINKLFKFQSLINNKNKNCYFFMYFKFNTIDSIKARFFFKKYDLKIQLIPIEKVNMFKLFNKIFISYNTKNSLLFFFPDILLNTNIFKSVSNYCALSCLYINNRLYYFPYLNLIYKYSIFNSYLKLSNILYISIKLFMLKQLFFFYFIISIFFFYIFFIFNFNYYLFYNNLFFKYI